MCGRFNVISDPLAKYLLEATGQTFALSDDYNIAPTADICVLRKSEQGEKAEIDDKNEEGLLELQMMRWWLVPSWSTDVSSKYSMFNARSESLDKSRAYSQPFKHRRCIIPASGYYEWQNADGQKRPFYISSADADGLLFAGLWDSWERGEGPALLSCTLVTRAAIGEMKNIHGRAPVMLGKKAAYTWLDQKSSPDSLRSMLQGKNGAGLTGIELNVMPVSSWVNNTRHKDEGCISATGESKIVRI